ncbi:hypothetical protein GEMRC1_003072 [Eukaryota sp. GEM-RC1]
MYTKPIPNIHVPTLDSTLKAIRLNFSEKLPPCDEVLDVLRGEIAPLSVFQLVALQYLSAGRTDDFRRILAVTLEAGAAAANYPELHLDRISILVSLSMFYLPQLLSSTADVLSTQQATQVDSYLSMAESADSTSNLVLLAKAVVSLTRGDVDKANTHITVVQSADSKNIPALYLHALIELQENRLKAALDSLRKLLVYCLDGHCGAPVFLPYVYCLMGFCFIKLNDLYKAGIALQRAQETLEGKPTALLSLLSFYLAYVSYDHHFSKESLDHLHSSLSLVSTSPSALLFLAKSLINVGDYDGALAVVREAQSRSINPVTTLECWYVEGVTHQVANRSADAMNCLRKVVEGCKKRGGEHIPAMFALGQIGFTLGRDDAQISYAFSVLAELGAKLPHSSSVMRLLAHRHLKFSHPQKAIDFSSKLLKDVSSNHEDWALSGEILVLHHSFLKQSRVF